jgi:hypothetical protein
MHSTWSIQELGDQYPEAHEEIDTQEGALDSWDYTRLS